MMPLVVVRLKGVDPVIWSPEVVDSTILEVVVGSAGPVVDGARLGSVMPLVVGGLEVELSVVCL